MTEEAKKAVKPLKICTRRFGMVLVVGGLLAIQDMSFMGGSMGFRPKAFTE